jgi:hypothetical protein
MVREHARKRVAFSGTAFEVPMALHIFQEHGWSLRLDECLQSDLVLLGDFFTLHTFVWKTFLTVETICVV